MQRREFIKGTLALAAIGILPHTASASQKGENMSKKIVILNHFIRDILKPHKTERVKILLK